jgi:hypothetical protein
VLAAAHAVFIVGQLGEPSDSMQERSMHDWDYVTSAAFGGNFRAMEQTQGCPDEDFLEKSFPATSATTVK